MEAELLARLAVIASNGLRSTKRWRTDGAPWQPRGLPVQDDALAAALDGQKTSLAYLGEVADLQTVVDELEPLLRRLGDHFRLHWTLFESGFAAVAAGDWAAADRSFEHALEANRQGGVPAYDRLAHRPSRLAGPAARPATTRRSTSAAAPSSCARTRPTPGARRSSAAQLGRTLRRNGRDARPRSSCSSAVASWPNRTARRHTCCAASAPLAEATGSIADIDGGRPDARGRLRRRPARRGCTGEGAYLSVARAWLARQEAERARDSPRADAGRGRAGALGRATRRRLPDRRPVRRGARLEPKRRAHC